LARANKFAASPLAASDRVVHHDAAT
jgi:hypothetical protein